MLFRSFTGKTRLQNTARETNSTTRIHTADLPGGGRRTDILEDKTTTRGGLPRSTFGPNAASYVETWAE